MEIYHPDRSKFSRGEWDNEPDRVDFIHAGFACFIQRNSHGALCGYVGVPSTHPAYEREYDDVDVSVHGGLTYANKCSDHLCHVPEPGMPDDVWWLGFDCNHHTDLAPLNYHAFSVNAGDDFPDMHSTYRNIEYVTNEIKQLAEQLSEMKSAS